MRDRNGKTKKREDTMKRFYTLAIAAMAVIGLALFAKPALAVHAGSGQLVCGQCHTMHNSQGSGAFVAAGNQLKLLRAATGNIHELCLTCHAEDGGNGTIAYTNDVGTAVMPPKVWKSSSLWTSADGFDTKMGAGGDFRGIGTVTAAGVVTLVGGDAVANYSLGTGHSLGAATVLPPGAADAAITNFTCTNCHDPHGKKAQVTDPAAQGVNVYRMLRVMPVGGGGGTGTETTGVVFNNAGTTSIVTYAGAASQGASGGLASNLQGENPGAATHVWPVFFNSSSNVYGAGLFNSDAVVGVGDMGMSGWCAQCHDNWHDDIATANKGTADWTRHPVNCDMQVDTGGVDGCFGVSGSGTTIIDYAHYETVVAAVPTRAVPMAKTADPGLGTYTSGKYYGTANTDRVFCLSCHFAHGGPYFDNLRWDYTSGVGSGSQTGNSLTSRTGCQQCHNRGN